MNSTENAGVYTTPVADKSFGHNTTTENANVSGLGTNIFGKLDLEILKCSEDDPYTDEFYQDITTWKIVIFTVCTAITVITIGMFLWSTAFVQKKLPTKRRRAHITWILGMYPVLSCTSLLALYVPRAHFIVSIHATLYFSVTLYRFVLLIFDYFGGLEAAIALLADEEVSIAISPLLCCFPCIKKVKVTRKFLVLMKRLAMQVAFIRPMTLFVASVLWTDDKYTPGQIAHDEAYVYLNTISIVSTLIAMYALNVIYHAAKEPLRGFKITKKFMTVQIALLLINIQHAFLGILVSANVIKCLDPVSSKTRANIIYNILIVLEMGILGVLSAFLFRTRTGNMRHLISRPSLWLKERGTEEQEMVDKSDEKANNNDLADAEPDSTDNVYTRRASLFQYALSYTEATEV